jgi:EmrB/QacA subfamily drug resistance transporter
MKTGSGERGRYFPRILAVIAAGFMIRVDIYIVNISLPSMARFFRVTTGEIAYVTFVYLLFVTSTMLLFGRLGDRFGLKKMLVAGYLLFTVSSLACGLSESLAMLLVARCFQGVGGALLFTSAFGIIPRIVPRKIEGWSYGLWTTACAVGVTVGAPLGGVISGFFSWRWIFFITVPAGLAAAFLAARVIPPDEEPSGPAPAGRKGFDVAGAVLSLFGLGTLVFALNRGPVLGWTATPVLAALAAAGALLGGFFLWERRHPDPVFPLSLFKRRGFLYASLAGLLGYLLVSGNSFLLPFYLELVHGLQPQTCGLMMLLYAVVIVIVSPRVGGLSDRVDPRRLGALAMALSAIAFGAFALTLGRPGLLPSALFLLLIGFALSFFFSPTNHLAMRSAPGEKRGICSGAYQTASNLGMVLGVCLFETAFSQQAGPIGGEAELVASGTAVLGDLLGGFRNAYWLGAIVCLAGLTVFVLSLKAKFRGHNT